ncbi:MAG TPA: ribbon-helix-helix protein, CopG family [Vicinamibacterales bacterium]|nr:ribbon-helix-helix protein, CopG family [Vicinamibacterales bacterium]
MKSLLIELDDETASRIERIAPGRSRQRSEFIRAAIRRALWEIEERETAEAYRPRRSDRCPRAIAANGRSNALWVAFTPLKPRFKGRPIELTGFFTATQDVNYIAIVSDGQQDRLSVVFHEYAHLVELP